MWQTCRQTGTQRARTTYIQRLPDNQAHRQTIRQAYRETQADSHTGSYQEAYSHISIQTETAKYISRGRPACRLRYIRIDYQTDMMTEIHTNIYTYRLANIHTHTCILTYMHTTRQRPADTHTHKGACCEADIHTDRQTNRKGCCPTYRLTKRHTHTYIHTGRQTPYMHTHTDRQTFRQA